MAVFPYQFIWAESKCPGQTHQTMYFGQMGPNCAALWPGHSGGRRGYSRFYSIAADAQVGRHERGTFCTALPICLPNVPHIRGVQRYIKKFSFALSVENMKGLIHWMHTSHSNWLPLHCGIMCIRMCVRMRKVIFDTYRLAYDWLWMCICWLSNAC
jgi:hypothetical protein